MKRYRHVYSLTLADINPENRMTPGAVLCYYQDTIARFLAEGRVGPFDIKEEGLVWMINEFHCRFDGFPSWPGIVQLEVFLSELSTIRIYVDYLARDVCGQIVARGTSVWVLADGQSRRMVPCRSHPRVVALYDEQNFVPHARFPFPSAFDAEAVRGQCLEHTVSSSETDFNGHMSNRDHVRLALSTIAPSLIEGRTIREFHVRFQQECHTGETLSCSCRDNGGGHIDLSLNKPDTTTVCLIATLWE